ncbi:MAG: hypothetical protein WAV40_02875, partial [Microgenomates group bacterium]
ISSDGGALSEVVGEGGIVIPLNSQFVRTLANTMTKLSDNSKLRAKLIAAGKKRVSEFSWTKAAKETLNYLINIGLTNIRPSDLDR